MIMRAQIHAFKILVLLVVFLSVSLSASPAAAMLPADAVYCRALGYDYFTATTEKGAIGVCVMPNGKWVNAWDFYTGKVALEWSYCAQQGLEARRDESGAFCEGCLVCKLPTGEEVWVVTLMGLSFRESVCGDGHCGTVETFDSCPGDCPSGGQDDYCDGNSDQICDPDCVGLGGTDPDCPDFFVDIKPGSCPNPLNVRTKGVLTAAILGTVNFDVTNIDLNSVLLSRDGLTETVPSLKWHIEDVATPIVATNCECWEVPGDRRPDLVLHFDAREVAEKLELSSQGGNTIPITLKATLKDGTEILGRDCIRVISK